MEAINNAFAGSDAFKKMLEKVSHLDAEQRALVGSLNSPEVREWNAEVDRKRAEKAARKALHTKALDGLRK